MTLGIPDRPVIVDGVEIPNVRSVVYTREVDNIDHVEIEMYVFDRPEELSGPFSTKDAIVEFILIDPTGQHPDIRFRAVNVEVDDFESMHP